MLRGVEMLLDETGKLPFTTETITLALSKRPADAQLMGAMADVMISRNELAEATAQLQKILELPIPPISLDGLRLFSIRNNARFMQTLWAGRLAANATEAERPKLLATAKSLREKLAAVEAPDSPQVLLVDGQLAFVEGDFGKANQLLDKHYKATRQRPNGDALLLQAQVAEKVNQLGLAKERLEECLKVQPSKLQALYMLAEIEGRLQNTDRALALFRNLLEMSPDNEALRDRVAFYSKVAGQSTDSQKLSDPVVADLLELRDIITPKEGVADRTPEGIAFLKRRLVDRKQDPRLVSQLAAMLAGQGNRDEALAVIKTGLAANPTNTDLKDFEISLTTSDQVEARLKIIESREAPQVEKHLARYQILREAGRIPEAEAQLAEAFKIAPADPRVTEYRFLDAITKPDWELAQKLTDEAIKANLDDANGLTYRARLLGAQRKLDEALAAITEAVGKGGALPEVWRIKGRIETQLGKTAESVESYRQALRLRPSDASTINDTISAMVDAGQAEEALKLAKESEKYAANNERFISNWLALEAKVGSKRFAIDRREQMAKNSPKDRDNLLRLAALYVEDRDWIKSRPLIDRARELGEGTDVLSLDAAWHWEQGEREKARTIFQTFISKFDKDKLTSYPFMLYAQFLASHDDDVAAVTVLEQARAYQDPKESEADKAIIEVHMKRANFEQAVAVCRRVISAGTDTPSQLYRMRLVECLAKLANYEAADTELKAMGTNIESDATTM
ncbi:MAG: tetratricopeptide repeat protein, partial [Planctomycetota bacterium]|nr:tetratricopeptide repeat protein [Planctomycetota bacterium]